MEANSCSYQQMFEELDEKCDRETGASTAGRYRAHYYIAIHSGPLLWKIRLNTMATAARIAKSRVARYQEGRCYVVGSLVIKKHSS